MGSSGFSNLSESKISGVIFDLDGTLLNTERASRTALEEFLGKYGKVLITDNKHGRVGRTQKESAVAIVENYCLPLSPDQFIQDITPLYRAKWAEAKALPGAGRLIKHLHKHRIPLALASNSSQEYIYAKISYHEGWKECFSAILGSDQVESGKPAPDLFLEAAKRIGVDAANCLVIEDSLVGVKAAKAAHMKVVVVPSKSEADSAHLADTALHSLLLFQPEQWGLPPFEDWVDKALPIDHIRLKGVYTNGHLAEFPGEPKEEGGLNALPDQVCGVYLGWAEVGELGTYKAIVSIASESTSNSHRKIQIYLLDKKGDVQSGQAMHLVLVGFIRGFDSEQRGSDSFLDISEEDESVTSTAFDKSIFKLP